MGERWLSFHPLGPRLFNRYFWIGGDDVKIDIFLPDQAHEFLGERTFDEILPARLKALPDHNLGDPFPFGHFGDRCRHLIAFNP